MGLNGGGYTFIKYTDLAYLSNDEVQTMFTDKSGFLLRTRRADATQYYGVLQQLSIYQYVSSPRQPFSTTFRVSAENWVHNTLQIGGLKLLNYRSLS